MVIELLSALQTRHRSFVPAIHSMMEFTLSFPAGHHFSSYSSATTTLQTDLYLRVNTNLLLNFAGQSPDTPFPELSEEPPVVFPQAEPSPHMENCNDFQPNGSVTARPEQLHFEHSYDRW